MKSLEHDDIILTHYGIGTKGVKALAAALKVPLRPPTHNIQSKHPFSSVLALSLACIYLQQLH